MDLTTSNSGEGTLVVEPKAAFQCLDNGSWLSVSASYLEIKTGDSTTLTVTADATFLDSGACLSVVIIDGTDPQQPMVVVPVTLAVD